MQPKQTLEPGDQSHGRADPCLLAMSLVACGALHGPCNSVAACQSLARQAFHKTVLIARDARLVPYGGGLGSEGLGLLWRLTASGEGFLTQANTVRPSSCPKERVESAPTGREFCNFVFENGAGAYFRAGGLTYVLTCVQEEGPVPRLPQIMAAVAAYGAP
jgi:hypothetical protein